MEKMKTSSFQKKMKAKIVEIPGTRLVAQNSYLVVSTGIPSLDSLLGGGLPVGSIILLGEDIFRRFSDLFLKTFLAEGVLCNHYSYICSFDEDPNAILGSLPYCSSDEPHSSSEDSSDEKMKIAWRYQNQTNCSCVTKHTSRNYDISRMMDENGIDKTKVFTYSNNIKPESTSYIESTYARLLSDIKKRITELNLTTDTNKPESNLLRVGIQSFFSPFWESDCNYWKNATIFMLHLRAVIRSSFSAAFVTMPSHLIKDQAIINRLSGLVDFCIELESFEGTEIQRLSIYDDYNGLVNIKRIAPLNTIIPQQLDTNDWAFRIKRVNLRIEKFHLPPDLSETANRNQSDPKKSKDLLDF